MDSNRAFQVAGLFMGAFGLWISYQGLKGGSDNQRDRWVDPGDQVLLIGDSIAEGLKKSLAHMLADYGSTLTDLTKVGSSAPYWASHVDQRDGGYKVIVLSLGSNDLLVDEETENKALDKLIADLQSHGAPVLWFLPPSFREDQLTAQQESFRQRLLARGVIQLQLEGPQPTVASDPMHLHPTPQGYVTLASQIFDALTRLE